MTNPQRITSALVCEDQLSQRSVPLVLVDTRQNFAVVNVRLRTDIVKLYGLSVCVTERISSQLWTLAARQRAAFLF